MGEAFTWCFAAPVFAFLAIVFIVFMMSQLAPDSPVAAVHVNERAKAMRADERALDCLRCSKKIRFVVPSPARIRCSCGNVMSKPDGTNGTCPKCCETIHVSRRREVYRVKCPCGNVAEVAA